MERHSPETSVARAHAAGAGLHREFQRIGNVGVQRLVGVHIHRAGRRSFGDERPIIRTRRTVKRTVAHHLGVNAALAGKIDFFKKNPEQIGTDNCARLVCLNRQRGSCLRLSGKRNESHRQNNPPTAEGKFFFG